MSIYPRTEYEMTEENLKIILEACRPVPVLFGNNGMNLGGSQQENSNIAWEKLGQSMGFDYLTVRPIEGKGNRFFTAIPSETEKQREEREANEAHEKKQKRINELRQEIADRETELKNLGWE